MFDVIAFKRSHLDVMIKQEINKFAQGFFSTVNYDTLEMLESFTGVIDGKPLVCGGIVPYWKGRGYLWAVFDEDAKDSFVAIFRGVKQFLRTARSMYNRIEVAIPCDFEIGLRRAKLLGFKVECERAVKFLPDGTDCSILVLLGGA